MKVILRSHYTPYCSVCSHRHLGGWKSFITFFLMRFEKVSAQLSCLQLLTFCGVFFMTRVHGFQNFAQWQTVALLQETQMSCSNSFPLRDYGIFSLPDICEACLSLHKQLSTLHFPKPSSPLHSNCAILPKRNYSERFKHLSYFSIAMKVNESAILRIFRVGFSCSHNALNTHRIISMTIITVDTVPKWSIVKIRAFKKLPPGGRKIIIWSLYHQATPWI